MYDVSAQFVVGVISEVIFREKIFYDERVNPFSGRLLATPISCTGGGLFTTPL